MAKEDIGKNLEAIKELLNLEISGADEDSYKGLFKTWMKKQTRTDKDGNVVNRWTDGTISSYISVLDKYKVNVAGQDIPVFECDALEPLISFRDELELDSEAEGGLDYNKSVKAMRAYVVFRESISHFGSETKYIEPQYHTGILPDMERNRIIFGAPGTGKSFQLKLDSEKVVTSYGGRIERVTFHSDYTYAQFVGTYKPVTDNDGIIQYDFVPGPFMRVYVNAIKNDRTTSPQPFILIVEEINRAKVASVFGDIFQLLDRNDEWYSEYEIITSIDLRKYLAKELGGVPENYFSIRIPDNMFIWATMNSADQGVFPMDTAFKRRWNFEYLGINEKESEIRGRIMLGTDIIQDVDWNVLRKAINEKLAKEYKVNEDKLMGPFFLSKKVLRTISEEDVTIADTDKFIEVFKSKVIMYLYEDAAKQHKHKLFSGCPDTTKYSAVCDSFDRIGIQIFGEDFEEAYYNPQKG